MFDPNADPIRVASRAAELALEQLERFRHRIKPIDPSDHKKITEEAIRFYSDPFEVSISNNINQLLAGYAVLMGYVTEAQANR